MENDRPFSLQVSRVMDDIGVNEFIIDFRRKTYLRIETMDNVCSLMKNMSETSYVFGSQSEATTTFGMKSDIDTLKSDQNVHVILKLNKWQDGKPNLLVLRNELTPPQHCYLQRLKDDCPLPAEQTEGPDDVLTGDGKVLVANTCVNVQELYGRDGEVFHRGPSISPSDKLDFVSAFQCAELPEECQFMFHRPRPGHWPRPEIMNRARQSVVFLVPQGYSESPASEETSKPTGYVGMIPSTSPNYPYSKRQWRFSTSLMERYLMFDFTTVQIKAYTLTKVIRKEVFKPQYGDRFSTFHIKTAMMYTVENYPPTIWREDNIVQCVSNILTTLTRWLKQKYCPHFTISGVNLFVGKLHKWELPKLCDIISNIVNTKLPCLFNIRMDNIGEKLRQYRGYESKQSSDMDTLLYFEISADALKKEFNYIRTRVESFSFERSVEILKKSLQIKLNSLSQIEQEAVSVLAPFIQSILATKLASRCISREEHITQDILDLYELSFDSDLMSSRLKFASMMYCNGQYEEAAVALTVCESLLGPEVCQYCTHAGRMHFGNEFHNLCTERIDNSSKKLLRTYITMCILFTEAEINCIPKHVAYELCRCIESEDRGPGDKWKDCIVIDCIPFLYYLQHLTYRKLKQQVEAQTALDNLQEYTKGPVHGHIETALNILGHCFELQDRHDQAWLCYRNSLSIYNKDNAAGWHLARIVHECIKKTMSPSGM